MKVKSAQQEATNRGVDAAMAGSPRDENPYSGNSPLSKWWDLGWLEYEEDDENQTKLVR